MPKRTPLTVVAALGRNVVDIRRRDTKQVRIDELTIEVSRLRAVIVAQTAHRTNARTQEIVHEVRGELASITFAAGEVVASYRCARNAAAGGHTELAAHYNRQLSSWIAQMAAAIDRPDTLYERFKTVLTR